MIASRLPVVRTVPVTVLMVVALSGLVVSWVGVRTGGGLATFDPVVVTWLAAHRPGWAVAVTSVVTLAGSPAAMTVVMVAITATVAWRRRSWMTVVVGGAGLGALAGADQLVKHVVARPRPPLVLQAVSAEGFSFPSGHTTLSAGVVLLVLWITTRPAGPGRRRDPDAATRWVVGLVAVLFLVAVAASRLVLGVHYPSDVWAGWCVAVLADGTVVLLAAALMGRWARAAPARFRALRQLQAPAPGPETHGSRRKEAS